ncbi:hypothetical protein GCM10023186_06410 [Hymenobacter koreensis]|uniref:Uncharacterized protein n=1 Tax=Hymenobacter koreensis TaxID=1084523 RepID=A0ABP8IV22_9BACT
MPSAGTVTVRRKMLSTRCQRGESDFAEAWEEEEGRASDTVGWAKLRQYAPATASVGGVAALTNNKTARLLGRAVR